MAIAALIAATGMAAIGAATSAANISMEVLRGTAEADAMLQALVTSRSALDACILAEATGSNPHIRISCALVEHNLIQVTADPARGRRVVTLLRM